MTQTLIGSMLLRDRGSVPVEAQANADRAAGQLEYKNKGLTTPSGFEPPISSVTGRHVGPLHHGAAEAQYI